MISPPSDRTQYLDIGLQLGASSEYSVLETIQGGLGGRFNLPSNQTNTVNNFGTIGPYDRGNPV